MTRRTGHDRGSVTGVLIAEELLLICLNDQTGRRSTGSELDPALAAAVLVELALAERITIAGHDEGRRQRGRVRVTFSTPTDDPVLDEALAYLEAHEGKKAADLISPMTWQPLSKGLTRRLLTRLAAAGVLTEQHGRALGVFPETRWPTADGRAEAEVRGRLRGALVDGTTPSERTAALVALLHAIGQVTRALPGEDRKLVKARAKALAQGDWAAQAVQQVVDAVTVVMITGAAAATAAT